jgi:hypothetical protein
MKLPLCAILLACSSLPASAQSSLYKCKVGNSTIYSDQPCADAPQKLHKDVTPDAPVVNTSDHVCAKKIADYARFDNPESIVIENIRKGNAAVIDYASGKVYAKTYYLKIAERSADGHYKSSHSYTCHVSEDEQRILKVSGPN